MKNRMIYQINDFSLQEEDLMYYETVFHNANGYIGVRSDFEEGYSQGINSIRGTYINGFYDIAPMKQAEKLYGLIEEKQTMLNVVDSQTIYIYIDDEKFSMFEGTVLSSKRLLDMENGYTLREIHWRSPKGREVKIAIKRMTSFLRRNLFLIEYKIESINFVGNVLIKSEHIGEVKNYCNIDDPRVAGESFNHLFPQSGYVKDNATFLEFGTSKSGLEVCTAVKNVINKPCEERCIIDNFKGIHEFNTTIAKGETLILLKYTIVNDSIRTKNLLEEVELCMQDILKKDYKDLYIEQSDYLNQFWDTAELEIDSDEELNRALKYNMYQLVQSAGRDEYSNIAAKGLSGEGYEGHFFWDTEMYIQPFFTLTNPDISKSLLSYRYATLSFAKENARIMGHRSGALYPWRTIMGKECSGFFPSGSAAYHINGGIAYAIAAYYLATKDLEFIAQKGAEIMFETARLWIDVGNYVKEKFCINEVTGPDEYTCMVNNNYYTNAAAQYNLYFAVLFYNLLQKEGLLGEVADKIFLTKEEVGAFSKAATSMYLPFNSELGINPQDDSFLEKKIWELEKTKKENFPLLLHYHPLYLYRHQVCKQADTVLAHFVFEDAQPLEVIRKSFTYYEKITTHDSSLSTCIFSIVAAKLGYVDKAYEYFGDSAKLDLFNTHNNTKDGIHTANMGGNYMTIVYGFGGLRIKEEGLFLAPMIPEKWNSFSFKFFYQDRKIKVIVSKKQSIIKLLLGESVDLYIYGKKYILEKELII